MASYMLQNRLLAVLRGRRSKHAHCHVCARISVLRLHPPRSAQVDKRVGGKPTVGKATYRQASVWCILKQLTGACTFMRQCGAYLSNPPRTWTEFIV